MLDPDRNEEDCRAVLAAYRKLRVPPELRASAWDRLQGAIEDPDIEPSIAYQRRRKPTGWAIALLTAAALVLLIAGLRRMAGPSPERPDHQAAQDAARADEPARTPSRADEPAPQPAPPPAPELTPDPEPQHDRRPARTSERPPADEPQATSLEAELSLLRAARSALSRHDAPAALRLLDDHARTFADGHLKEERMVLRAQALCELGDRPGAREAAAQLLRAYPNSPNARAASCPDP
jgi:hypothetical protein